MKIAIGRSEGRARQGDKISRIQCLQFEIVLLRAWTCRLQSVKRLSPLASAIVLWAVQAPFFARMYPGFPAGQGQSFVNQTIQSVDSFCVQKFATDMSMT
jgi:hypothetical protein